MTTVAPLSGEDRLRERQGQALLLDDAPCPDPATTASLLPGVIVGEYLRRHAHAVGGRLLDLGAGNQPYSVWYRSRCERWTAVDVAAHDGIAALCTAEHLPFEDASFDTVLATEVLEHVTDHEAALDEIERVLAPGGRVVVTVPFLYPIHEAPHDHRRLTSHGLRSSLERRSLVVEDLSAKGGATTLVANVALTAGCAAVRAALARTPSAAARQRGHRSLVGLERILLRQRAAAQPFPASARRVSLGYMAIGAKPAAG